MEQYGVTSEQMFEIDRIAQEQYGIDEIVLMENAGNSAADIIINDGIQKNDSIAIFCGKGNNGADGFVIARNLYNYGIKTIVYIENYSKIKKNASLKNLKIVEKMNIEIKTFEQFLNSNDIFTLYVDALFGIGFRDNFSGIYLKIAKKINSLQKKVYAIDIPSGLNANTGVAVKSAIKADKTITFGLPKKGFFINNGPNLCGEIIVKNIGFPKQLLKLYK